MADALPTPRRSRLKILLVVALALALVLLATGVVVRAMLPEIARKRIEVEATNYLGTPVTVRNLSLSLLAGSVTLEGIVIKGPDGFSDRPFFSCKTLHGAVTLRSLRSDMVVIEEIVLESPELNLEANGQQKQNLRLLLDKIGKKAEDVAEKLPEPAQAAPDAPKSKPTTRGLVIQDLRISDARVHFGDIADGKPRTASIGVGSLRLRDVGVPKPRAKLPKPVAELQLEKVSLQSTDAFEHPEFLSMRRLGLGVDLQLLLESQETPQVEVSFLHWEGGTVTLERIHSDTGGPDNLAAFLAVIRGATEPRDTAAPPAGQPVPTQPTPPPAEPAPKKDQGFDHFLVTDLAITELEFHNIDRVKEEKTFAIYDTRIGGKNLRFPALVDGKASLELEARPLDRRSLLKLAAEGDFLSDGPVRNTQVRLDSTDQSLERIGPFDHGRTDTHLTLSINEGGGKGELRARLREFDLKKSSNSPIQAALFTPLVALQKVQLPELKVPISFSRRGDGNWEDVVNALVGSLRETLPSAVGDVSRMVVENLGKLPDAAMGAVDEVGKAGGQILDTVGDVGKSTGVQDAVEGGAKEVEKTAEKIGSGIGDLFGRKKKE